MKEIAALGGAALVAAAAALWFTTKPVLVQMEIKALQASDEIPTFKPVRRAED